MRYEHAYVGERTERTRRIHDKLSLLIRTDCDLCGQGASKQGAEHDASRQIIGSSLRASFYQHAICHRPVECAAVARNALRAARLISLTHRRWPSGKPRSRAARVYRLARRRGGHAAHGARAATGEAADHRILGLVYGEGHEAVDPGFRAAFARARLDRRSHRCTLQLIKLHFDPPSQGPDCRIISNWRGAVTAVLRPPAPSAARLVQSWSPQGGPCRATPLSERTGSTS